MTTLRKTCAAALLLLPWMCHGLIETCADLQAAFALTQTQDVMEEIHPFQEIVCDTYTNMSMNSNTLTVSSSENMDNFGGSGTLRRVRMEVTDGAKLIWETNVVFDGVADEEAIDNNGGGVFVGTGSTVRFLNNIEMMDVRIVSVAETGTDFAQYSRSGGCVWTDGFFRVDGKATFTRCDVIGGGETPPGPGGALWVGKSGSVLFNGGVDISETAITDDDGAPGGGIYNLGKVIIKGNSRFEDLRGGAGGAIYNGEDARFIFKKKATAFFRLVANRDADGSALFNYGFFKLSGPALFLDAQPPVIVAAGTSETVISKNSAFWALDGAGADAIVSRSDSASDSAVVKIDSSVAFVGFAQPSV